MTAQIGTRSPLPGPPRPRAIRSGPSRRPATDLPVAGALTADDLPAGFEDILEVQVLGYRERIESLDGGDRQHVLDPVWTLIPKV